jgi:hypothetical protein
MLSSRVLMASGAWVLASDLTSRERWKQRWVAFGSATSSGTPALHIVRNAHKLRQRLANAGDEGGIGLHGYPAAYGIDTRSAEAIAESGLL